MHRRDALLRLLATGLLSGGPWAGRGNQAFATGPRMTVGCRASIDKGTNWLLSAMRRDGAIGVDIDQPPDLACTAITGLAFLSQGSTPAGGPCSKELGLILDSVLNMVDRIPAATHNRSTITLVQRKIGQQADLFFAAFFLSQIFGEMESTHSEQEVRTSLEKLVNIICRTQGEDGTWGDESWAPVLGTVMGWESLRASASAGVRVDASAKLAGDALLKKLKAKAAGRDEDWMHSFYKDASSIRVLYSLKLRDEPVFQECVDRILKVAKEDSRPFQQAGGEEYLAFYLVTECLLKEQKPAWLAWYPTVRDKLIKVQNADGSWSGHHCITGRTFCTAAVLMTLQAPNLYLPASSL